MLRIVIGVLFALSLFSGPAYAQGSTGRRHQDPNYLVVRTVSEAIVSVNLASSELVLKDFDGKDHTVKVNAETKFPDPGAKSLAELRAGQRIRISYRVADSLAMEIRLITPPR